MAFHIDQLAREYERGGMNAGEAVRAAEARFGRVLRLKEQGHDIRTDALVRRPRARHASHGAGPAQESRLHHHGRAHARARHRRQHRDLLDRRSAPAAAAAVSERRRADDGLRPHAEARDARHRARPHAQLGLPRQLDGLAAREPLVPELRRVDAALGDAHGRRRTGAARRAARLVGVLPAARRASPARPSPLGGGRPSERAAGRHPRASPVAVTLRQRPRASSAAPCRSTMRRCRLSA